MKLKRKLNYAEVLRAEAKRYHVTEPEQKALSYLDLRNRANIARWRARFARYTARQQEASMDAHFLWT